MKILIVDDEPGLASGLAQWLVDNGWDHPGVATGSDEAIAWLNENGRVDVLITDVVLSKSDGFTLREKFQHHLPKMKTIFISGYDLSEYASRINGALILPKPVTGEALDDAIRALYESPAPTAAAPTVAAPSVAAPSAATPMAKPAAPSGTPRAAVASVGTPVVAPRAVAVSAGATAKPSVVAKSPTAVPVASPKPAVVAASPRPVAASAPSAPKAPSAPRAGVAAKPAQTPQGSFEMELPPDELVGRTIGTYRLDAKIGEGSRGGIYRALQTNISRQVRFCVLDPHRAQNAGEIESFIANASVKANVSHPYIFAVYEAGHAEGIYFYSCEYIPCRSLIQMAQAGQPLTETAALQAMKVTAETLAYFDRANIPHHLITADSILFGEKNKPRVANIAVHHPTVTFDQRQEMAELGRIIAEALPETAQALGIRALAAGLASGALQFPSWEDLVKAITDLEPRVAPEDAYKLDAQERAAIRMVEEAKKKQRRNMLTSSLVSLGLLAVALGAVYWAFFSGQTKGKVFNKTITIPAGEFVYQDGQKVTLPEFNIDEYEVTIAQYAEFLKYLKDHPAEADKFDHPEQPKGKTHVPEGWADQTSIDMPGYYTRAQRWGKYENAKLDVNSPVFGVDWFDAAAYAKWKGRRLPTEQEWEKSGRGTNGTLYPWGNEPNNKFVNSGIDYNLDPKKGGEVDGFDAWSPVDAVKQDKSSYGVYDLAGNVSEWTNSFDTDPMLAGQKVPVIRGGNYRTPNDYALTRRVLKLTSLQNDKALGFRTAGDGPAVESPAK